MGRKKYSGLLLSLFLLLNPLFTSLFFPTAVFADPPTNFTSEVLITNLTEPTGITFAPDGRMFILERAGVIKIVQPGASVVDPTPLLQITNINIVDGERGLVGMS